MSDELIVVGFLEENFEPIIGQGMAEFYDKQTHRTLSNYDFNEFIRKIFGSWSDAEKQPYEIVTKWFYEKKKIITKEVDEYLEGCSVRLGLTNWMVITPEGKIMNEHDMIKKLTPKFDRVFIEEYFTDWMSEKILEVSSKMMGEY